ncbi:hypothetical protein BDN72DRAFT_957825 [Pluteus cervinus]|uniref:Uncharacterized protein n=1 Tax=Pluteus cervinus TaxID=181527 RepID=A0ACD3B1P7_9AGAR|nr:hypothetical protein BDN72DRAFT_957825 [Pluteus cervinus]
MVSLPDKDLVVTPLQHAQALRAARTFTLAFGNDPLMRYLTSNRSVKELFQHGEEAFMTVIMNLWILRRITLTVESGRGILVATPDRATAKAHNYANTVVDWLTTTLFHAVGALGTADERQRRQEVHTKIHDAATTAFGNRLEDMYFLDVLAVEPESKGLGYDDALLSTFASIAKLTHKAIWLHTSNPAHHRFYETHGFRRVARLVIGDQNPNWHEPPVITYILSLQPGQYKPTETL